MTSRTLERSTSQPVLKDGWLYKAGGATNRKWQTRWFKLQDATLYYYIKKEDTNPQGLIQLNEVQDISKADEYAGRQYCLSLLTTNKGKKVYYLSADTQDCIDEWYTALKSRHSPSVTNQSPVTYATAEVFLTEGVRISGNVHYGILSSISQRSGPEKKRRDNFGWFCECQVALATVLNLFSEHGWITERVYRSSAVSPIDNTLHPAVRVIFIRRLSSEDADRDDRSDSMKESTLSLLHPNVPPLPPPPVHIPKDVKLLEGTDDELLTLMQEFDIPINLLFQPD